MVDGLVSSRSFFSATGSWWLRMPNLLQHRRRRRRLPKGPLVHVMGPEDYWAKFFARHGLQRDRRPDDIRVDSSATAAELACAGNRVALIQDRLSGSYRDTGRLVQVIDDGLEVDEALYILLAETRERRKPEALLFHDWLLAEYRGHLKMRSGHT